MRIYIWVFPKIGVGGTTIFGNTHLLQNIESWSNYFVSPLPITQTDRDVIASRPYGVRRSIFVALLRQCATAAPQWTSYLKRWVCGAVGCHVLCQKIGCFLLDFGFDMGKSGLKPQKKTTNAKDKSRTFTLWSYKSRSPFVPPFRGVQSFLVPLMKHCRM